MASGPVDAGRTPLSRRCRGEDRLGGTVDAFYRIPGWGVVGHGGAEAMTAMYGYGHDMNGWGYAVMVFIMLTLSALLVVSITLFIRRSARYDRPTAERVLAERYARGEIDSEEYASRQSVLRARF